MVAISFSVVVEIVEKSDLFVAPNKTCASRN